MANLNRRQFMKGIGAGAAVALPVAGLAAAGKPLDTEKIADNLAKVSRAAKQSATKLDGLIFPILKNNYFIQRKPIKGEVFFDRENNQQMQFGGEDKQLVIVVIPDETTGRLKCYREEDCIESLNEIAAISKKIYVPYKVNRGYLTYLLELKDDYLIDWQKRRVIWHNQQQSRRNLIVC